MKSKPVQVYDDNGDNRFPKKPNTVFAELYNVDGIEEGEAAKILMVDVEALHNDLLMDAKIGRDVGTILLSNLKYKWILTDARIVDHQVHEEFGWFTYCKVEGYELRPVAEEPAWSRYRPVADRIDNLFKEKTDGL